MATPKRKDTLKHFAERLGHRVARLRAQKGYSQERLAKRLGIGTSHLAKIETGARKPSLDVLWALARQLEVDARELLDFRDQPDDWQGSEAETEWQEFRTLLAGTSADDVRVLREVAKRIWRH